MLGIVTVLYKSDGVIEGFLKSVAAQTFKQYKIYLVDNSVNDKSSELINSLLVKYRIGNFVHFKSEENVGIAEGNNIGMKMALADGCSQICLSNNDIVFDNSNLFELLMREAEALSPSVLAPKIYMEDAQTLWYAGGRFLFFRGSVWHDGYNKKDMGKFDQRREVMFAPACFVFVPRVVVEKVGFMDEKYFVYADDADYMLRVIRSGFKIVYLPELTICHKVSSSTGGVFSEFGLYYNTRNRVYWVRKFFKGFSKYIPLMYILVQMIYHSIRLNKRGSMRIILKGYKDGFSMQK